MDLQFSTNRLLGKRYFYTAVCRGQYEYTTRKIKWSNTLIVE